MEAAAKDSSAHSAVEDSEAAAEVWSAASRLTRRLGG